MKIDLTGWSRNCGIKTMIDRPLSPDMSSYDRSLSMGEIMLRRTDADKDLFDGIDILFSTSIKLGGDHFVSLRQSRRELMLLLNICNSGDGRRKFRRLRSVG